MKLKALLSVLVLAMCVCFNANAKDVVIGLSLDTLKEARWQKDRDMFVAEAEKLGAKVLCTGQQNSDDTRQIKDVKSLITNGVDCIVIVSS